MCAQNQDSDHVTDGGKSIGFGGRMSVSHLRVQLFGVSHAMKVLQNPHSSIQMLLSYRAEWVPVGQVSGDTGTLELILLTNARVHLPLQVVCPS